MEKITSQINWDINSHAYIFLGSEENTAKQARFLAQKANCQNQSLAPCGTCLDCRKIEKGIHPDVINIHPNGASIKIEQVRNLILRLAEKPIEGAKKVFIMHNAHTMTPQAQNALLKTLEEPLGSSIAVLLSDNLKKLLPTVISRCQVFDFSEVVESNLTLEAREQIAKLILAPIKDKNPMDIGSRVKKLSDREEKLEDLLEYIASLYRDLLVVNTNSNANLINVDLKDIIEKSAKILSAVDIVKALDEIYIQYRAAKSRGNSNLIWYNLLVGLEEVV